MQLHQRPRVGYALDPPGRRIPMPSRIWDFPRWRIALGFAAALALACGIANRPLDMARALEPHCSDPTDGLFPIGEFGACLNGLSRFYHPPQCPEESNYLFDMWADQKLVLYARQGGLTNNHALLINAHGERHLLEHQSRYAIVPHQSLLPPGQPPPHYSARDLASFLGSQAASTIHIVLLGGCDDHQTFELREWREAFPNATNIIHASPGRAGYQPMLLQVLFCPSSRIKPLFQTEEINERGETEYYLTGRRTPGATRLSPYLADLFLPGQFRPFRRQIAGRELFEAGQPE